VQDHEDLLLDGVAVLGSGRLAGLDDHVLQASRLRAGRPADPAARARDASALDAHWLDVIEIGDGLRPWSRLLWELRGAQLGLADKLDWGPVDEVRKARDSPASYQRHPQPREADTLVPLARAESQEVDRFERMQRVGAAVRRVNDAVARADLGGLSSVPR